MLSRNPSRELIPFASRPIGDETVPTVDGQDIYAFLGLAKAYPTWIKTQIKRLKLVENRDYIVYSSEGTNPKGGRPAVDYHFTFDAAKHIGLIAGCNKGHDVREYFIAKEKELRALQEEENQHPLVRQAKAIARLEARQDVQEHRLQALEARKPPAGKLLIADWIAQQGKPRLYGDQWTQLKARCRVIEVPAMFRPEGLDYPLPFYTPETIARAYTEVTRQISFLSEAPSRYGRRAR